MLEKFYLLMNLAAEMVGVQLVEGGVLADLEQLLERVLAALLERGVL